MRSLSLCTSLAWWVILSLVEPSACSSCAGATLFFSQYQQQQATSEQPPTTTGTGNYLQIYNPLGVVVNLAEEFSIATCLNGCARADTFEYGFRFTFGATIAAHGTYTLCGAGVKERTGCDEVLASPSVSYTGNDLVALIYGTDHTRA